MLGFRRKRTNLHEKYDHPYITAGLSDSSSTWMAASHARMVFPLDRLRSLANAARRGRGSVART